MQILGYEKNRLQDKQEHNSEMCHMLLHPLAKWWKEKKLICISLILFFATY